MKFPLYQFTSSFLFQQIQNAFTSNVSNLAGGLIVNSENKWTFQEIKIPPTPSLARFPRRNTLSKTPRQCPVNCRFYYIIQSNAFSSLVFRNLRLILILTLYSDARDRQKSCLILPEFNKTIKREIYRLENMWNGSISQGYKGEHVCAENKEKKEVVGLPGIEPGTSRLSGVRSNRLSYKPTMRILKRRDVRENTRVLSLSKCSINYTS